MKDLKAKDLRKMAFAVGLGFTVGKRVGGLINAGINGACKGFVKALASCGNESAAYACESVGIDYESNKKDNSR